MSKKSWARATAWACAAVLLAGCVSIRTEGNSVEAKVVSPMNPSATGFINKTLHNGKRARSYVVYVPREYNPDREWPLIVFLHGAGERGDNGLAQSDVGIGRAIRFHPERFPSLVVMPQCPEGVWWDDAIQDIDASIEETLRDYNVDRSRIYLTGLSMGGFGTWQYGALHIDRFAAFMPVCGGGRLEDAAKLATRPIWAFHGAKDSVVSVEESRKMVEAVRNAGGDVQYTEYPDLDHNSWDAAYGDAKAIKWLLDQRKETP
jgi:predicted peptidase